MSDLVKREETQAILGALSDMCDCSYTDDKYNDPMPPRHKCVQCRAHAHIEALEAEVAALTKELRDADDETARFQQSAIHAEAKAARLVEALKEIAEITTGDQGFVNSDGTFAWYLKTLARKALEETP